MHASIRLSGESESMDAGCTEPLHGMSRVMTEWVASEIDGKEVETHGVEWS